MVWPKTQKESPFLLSPYVSSFGGSAFLVTSLMFCHFLTNEAARAVLAIKPGTVTLPWVLGECQARTVPFQTRGTLLEAAIRVLWLYFFFFKKMC